MAEINAVNGQSGTPSRSTSLAVRSDRTLPKLASTLAHELRAVLRPQPQLIGGAWTDHVLFERLAD